MGYYTEILFPDKGVRFIAVNNSIDSDSQTENEFTPFLNIMNEWYARDTSKKIKAIFRNRMEHGLRCSGAVPYGYRMAEDKSLVVDPEAAEVVKRIYALAAEGKPLRAIAEVLSADKVLIPSAYWEQREGMVSRNHRYKLIIRLISAATMKWEMWTVSAEIPSEILSPSTTWFRS